MLSAVDCSLPVEVCCRHLSSRGLYLADSVLSQQPASSQLHLFRCSTSPAMSLLSLTVVSHSDGLPRSRLPRSRLRMFQCAISPAMSVLSLTVISHSGRLLHSRSPSSQSVASISVCYLSCHVFAIANRCFSQPSSSLDPAAAPYAIVPLWELNLLFFGWVRVRGSLGFG
jgi:hypothetical protein